MNVTDLLLYVSELCLYFSSVGAVISCFGTVLPYAVYPAVLFASELLSALLSARSGWVRALPLLLPVPLLVFAPSVAAFVLPLPICILLLRRFGTGLWHAGEENVRFLFKFGLILYAAILFFSLADKDFSAAVRLRSPLFVIFIVLTVLALRFLRTEGLAAQNRPLRVMNLVSVLAAAGLGALLASEGSLGVMRGTVSLLFRYVIAPVMAATAVVISAVPYLIYLLIRLLSGSGQEAQSALVEFDEVTAAILPGRAPGEASAEFLRNALIGGAILLFLLVCFYVTRALLTGRGKLPLKAAETVRTAAGPEPKRKNDLPVFFSGPAGTVRGCYRRYLALCRRLSVPVDGSLASDAILKASLSATGGETAALRELWLKARFSEDTVTKEDAEAAKKAFRSIRTAFARSRKV